MNISTDSKRYHELLKILEDTEYPAINQIEFERLITATRSIHGFKSKRKSDILDLLSTMNLLKKVETVDKEGEQYSIYLLQGKNCDVFDVASTRSRSAYFSHYSALFINGLTLQIPKQIYLSNERALPNLSTAAELKQENIDKALSKPARVTTNKRLYQEYAINFLQSQGYNQLGVRKFRTIYRVTNLERTLIDASVRPFYSGGVTQVLEAYENAKGKLKVDRLLRYYTQMRFIYPYHQVIGFYLERAGYPLADQELFDKIEKKFSFYLTYNMPQVMYSEKWKLYYPKGL